MMREWQNKALEFFDKNPRCIIEAATGTGKTYLAVQLLNKVLEKDPKARCLIVVPKNVILEETWFPELSRNFAITQIGMYYGEVKSEAQITITNMQNLHKLDLYKYNMHFYDELHNYMSDRLLEYLRLPSEYKVGLTATLHRKDHKHWKVMEPFGYNVFKYSLTDGVNDKILSDFNFHNIGISLPSDEREEYDEIDKKLRLISFMKKDNKLDEAERLNEYKLLDRRRRILGLSRKKISVFEMLKDRLQGRKIIVFNEYNASAPLCYWSMLDHGFSPCVFNSDIPKKDRYANLEDYRNDVYDSIITTRALDEGYNLPRIDAVVILCGGSSDRQTIQRIGRALRKKVSDTDVYQVYFIDTIEQEYAYKRYELMQESCSSFEDLRWVDDE